MILYDLIWSHKGLSEHNILIYIHILFVICFFGWNDFNREIIMLVLWSPCSTTPRHGSQILPRNVQHLQITFCQFPPEAQLEIPWMILGICHLEIRTHIWLVVEPYPSEKWWSERQLGWFSIPNWMERPKIPWFQTINQTFFRCCYEKRGLVLDSILLGSLQPMRHQSPKSQKWLFSPFI